MRNPSWIWNVYFFQSEDNWENKIRVSYHDTMWRGLRASSGNSWKDFVFNDNWAYVCFDSYPYISFGPWEIRELSFSLKYFKYISYIGPLFFIFFPFKSVDFDMQERNISQQIYFDYFENAKVLIYFINYVE